MIFDNEHPNKQKINERRGRSTYPTPNSGLGKLPPQAIDLEEAVLGALMLEPVDDSFWSRFEPQLFYVDKHQRIADTIINLRSANEPIDILTVTAKLRKQGELEMIGGAYYITELTNRVASAANIEYHITIVLQKFIQREIIRISTQAIGSAYDDTTDCLELLDEAKNALGNIQKGIYITSEKDSQELVDELRFEMSKERINGLLGISSGFQTVDAILKGDQEGDVRIIAGSTSMGKSALECSEVLNCCFDEKQELLKEQIPVVIFNLEMKSVKFSTRLLANLSSIEKDKISFNKFTPQERVRYEKYLNLFTQSKIFIEDRSELSINQFESSVAALVKKHGIKKVYIDYVQLMKADPNKKYNTRELELADIGRRIKSCAKKHKITIVELLQLNDEVLKAKNCIPNLSHIRECKALAHDADNVIFIWRPEYYDHVIEQLQEIYCPLFEIKITDFKNLAFLIIAKNREGALGKIPIKFKGGIMRMYDHPLVIDAMATMNNNLFNNVIGEDIPF